MRHLIILVHGIRTYAHWMDDLVPPLENAGFKVATTSYGRFNLLRFLVPLKFLKEDSIERIRTQIQQAKDKHRPDKISIIAHSYGTHVMSRILQRHPEFQFQKIIFCGSVLDDAFPFNQYQDRFEELLNEVGTKDCLPVLAQSITWGYGSIGAHGLRNPAARNRWHDGYKHSDFLTPEFCTKFWLPYLSSEFVVPGDKARPGRCARVLSMFPLRWPILLGSVLTILFWPYIYVPQYSPPQNLNNCELYRETNSDEWRNKYLRADGRGTYYVILKSITQFRDYPLLNEIYAKLEASRLRRKFYKADVDGFQTAGTNGGNRMWAILLARGLSDRLQACAIRDVANDCGLNDARDTYVYQLGSGVERCVTDKDSLE